MDSRKILLRAHGKMDKTFKQIIVHREPLQPNVYPVTTLGRDCKTRYTENKMTSENEVLAAILV